MYVSFYGVTGSVLGVYEAFAKVTRCVPTVSTWAARRRRRKVVLILWALGLAAHLYRHEAD